MITNINHPSRTDRHVMKLQQTATGLVFEFSPPDAREYVKQGGWSYAPASTTSVRETLAGMSTAQLQALATQYPAFRTGAAALSVQGVHQSEHDYLVDALIPSIQNGHITLS
ncbi:MAG TPA: hypothetical protein VGM82_00975 [Gemmatimonadaceae bacterium]|jgi:hypothetical protein